jgi:hypothetical protein
MMMKLRRRCDLALLVLAAPVPAPAKTRLLLSFSDNDLKERSEGAVPQAFVAMRRLD